MKIPFRVAAVLLVFFAIPCAGRDVWIPAQARTLAVPVPSNFGHASSATLVIVPDVSGAIDIALEMQLLQPGRPPQVRRAQVQRIDARAGEPLELDVTAFLPAALEAGRDYVRVRFDAPASALGLRFAYERPAASLKQQLDAGAKGQPFDELRAELTKEIARLDGILIGLSEELNSEVGRLDGILIGLSEELRSEVGRLDGILIGLSEELRAVDGKVAFNKGEIDKHKLDLQSHKLDIEKNKADILERKLLFDGLKQEFESKKSEYESKLAELAGKTGSVDTKVDNTKQELQDKLASKDLLGLTKEELKQLLASKTELQQQKEEILKKAVDDKLKKDYENVDFALDKQKQTLLAMKQSLIAEKEAAVSEEKKLKLQQILDELQQQEDDLRNVRELAHVGFENFDAKQNQLFTLLSNIMKTFNEMRLLALQNML